MKIFIRTAALAAAIMFGLASTAVGADSLRIPGPSQLTSLFTASTATNVLQAKTNTYTVGTGNTNRIVVNGKTLAMQMRVQGNDAAASNAVVLYFYPSLTGDGQYDANKCVVKWSVTPNGTTAVTMSTNVAESVVGAYPYLYLVTFENANTADLTNCTFNYLSK
jgi:hypothetical protein